MSQISSLKIKAKLLQKSKRRAGITMPLKDAFALIAKLAGYPSWQEMKEVLEETELFSPPKTSAFWKAWYSSYEEAKTDLGTVNSRFLLPYGRQFFLCDEHYLAWLGIEAKDPDLLSVGNNWAEPLDQRAWGRILQKIRRQAEDRAKIS